MIKKIIISSVFALSVYACQSLDKPAKPSKLIEEDRMVDILTDVAFVKAAKGSYKKVFDLENINPENYILQKHGIDSITFSENNIWYTNQIETYKKIFTKVKSNLEISKQKFEKLNKEADSIKKVKDSIKAAKKGEKLKKDTEILNELLDPEEEEAISKKIEKAKRKKGEVKPPSSKRKQFP